MKRSFLLSFLLLFLCPALLSAGESSQEAKRRRAKAWEGIARIGQQKSGILSLLDASSNHKGSLFSGGSLVKKPLAKDAVIPSCVNIFLIHTQKKLFLIDTGFGGKKGQLASKLALLEVKPEKITGILLTHIHPDHIGGLLQEDGSAVYPKAILYLSRKEYNWNMRRSAPLYTSFARISAAYKNRIKLLSHGGRIEGGFTLLEASGHTPGHSVYRYKDILFIGDLLHAASLQFQDPEICAAYDMNRRRAVAARKRIFSLAAAQGLKIAGAHIPFPGWGQLQKEGTSFHFLPEE